MGFVAWARQVMGDGPVTPRFHGELATATLAPTLYLDLLLQTLLACFSHHHTHYTLPHIVINTKLSLFALYLSLYPPVNSFSL